MSQRTVSISEARELAKQERGRRWGKRRAAEREAQATRRERFRLGTKPASVRLPWPPALNHYWRRVVVAGHAVTYISAAGKAYRKEVIELWAKVGVTFHGRLAVRITAIFPDARERDLDGLLKAPLDALEHAGAFERDSQVKLLIVEHVATNSPGWIDLVIGPEPGERQGTLFETKW